MVNTATNGPGSGITVDLARALIDRPQKVSVRINGFDFPGEVIFADQWQAWFGASLPERTMFRLVLLSEHQRIDSSDVRGRFIAVAIPSEAEPVQTDSEFTQLSRELGRLNEIREQYIVSNDYDLHSLTASLTDNASRTQHTITSVLATRWRRGRVIASSLHGVSSVQPDSIFVGEDPAAWVEAIAATMFTHHSDADDAAVYPFDPEATFARMLGDDRQQWEAALDSRVRFATGGGLDSILEELDTSTSAEVNEAMPYRIQSASLRALLLDHYGLPPGLATLVALAYVKLRDGEAETDDRNGGAIRIDRHTLGTYVYDADLIYSIDWLSPHHSADWNSALPYVRVLLPNAERSITSKPGESVTTLFDQTLETMASRATLTLHTLESISGPAVNQLPEVSLTRQLVPVLESDNWRSFYSLAREQFSSVTDFVDAVAEFSRLRILGEDIIDLQAAHNYLATADFGRVDHGLAKEAMILLETVDVQSILENRTPASVELERYQSWKRRFTRSYIEHHAERRSADMELVRRIKRADSRHVAVKKLAVIPELEGIYDSKFEQTWDELKERAKPCPNGDNEVSLQRQPYCVDCGVRLGSTGHEDEVEARIAQVEDMLQRCSNRLSEIAASRALSGEREVELRKLISINSIADLTALSNVLNEGVTRFLKRFASDASSPA